VALTAIETAPQGRSHIDENQCRKHRYHDGLRRPAQGNQSIEAKNVDDQWRQDGKGQGIASANSTASRTGA
jgi:hypothetical protein